MKKFDWEKTPIEVKTYTNDFVNKVAVGETIASAIVTASVDGVNDPDMVEDIVFTGTVVAFVLAGGDAGKTYDISVVATANSGMIYEDNGYLTIL